MEQKKQEFMKQSKTASRILIVAAIYFFGFSFWSGLNPWPTVVLGIILLLFASYVRPKKQMEEDQDYCATTPEENAELNEKLNNR